MILTIEQIEEFFDFGLNKLKDVEYMLMVRDSFNGEYYPVYIRKSDDYDEVVVEHNQNMQRVVECYDLTLPKEGQIVTGHNVWHGPDQRNQTLLAAQVDAARPKMAREEIISTCHNCKVEAAAHEAIDVIAECTEGDVDFGVAFIIVTRDGDYVASKYDAGEAGFHYTTNPLLAAMYTTLDKALNDVELYTQDPEFTTRHWGVRELLGTVLPFHELP